MAEPTRKVLRSMVEKERENIKKTRYVSPGTAAGWQAEATHLQTLAILDLAATIEKASKA